MGEKYFPPNFKKGAYIAFIVKFMHHKIGNGQFVGFPMKRPQFGGVDVAVAMVFPYGLKEMIKKKEK